MIVRTVHIRHPQIWVLQPWLFLVLQAMLPLAWLSPHLAEAHLWQPLDTRTHTLAWLSIGTLSAFVWLMKSIRMRAVLPTRVSSGSTLYPSAAFLIVAWLIIAPSRIALHVSESINRSLRPRQDLIEDARVLGLERAARQVNERARLLICDKLRDEPARFEAAARRYVPPSENRILMDEINGALRTCNATIASDNDVLLRFETRFDQIAISHNLAYWNTPIENRHGFWIIGLVVALLLVTVFILWASVGITILSRVLFLGTTLGLLAQRLNDIRPFPEREFLATNDLNLIVFTWLAFSLLVFTCKKRNQLSDHLIAISMSFPCTFCIAITPAQDLNWLIYSPNSLHNPLWENTLQLVFCWFVASPLVGYGLTRYARKPAKS